MAKPLHEFGGWLRFIQVGKIYSIASFLIMTILFFAGVNYSYDIPTPNWPERLLQLLACFGDLYMLLILQKRQPWVPTALVRIQVGLMLFVLIGNSILPDTSMKSNEIPITIMIILFLVVSAIWTAYFRSSKRVLLYYGANADLKRAGFLS